MYRMFIQACEQRTTVNSCGVTEKLCCCSLLAVISTHTVGLDM